MGLDMYLTKKMYIGGEWDSRKVKGSVKLSIYTDMPQETLIEIPANEISEITFSAATWRKANQIHHWFVKNVQNGVDDCNEVEVEVYQLNELRRVCEAILEARGNESESSVLKLIDETLPPQEGFFFGSTEVDDYYFENLEYTVKVLSSLDNECMYFYRSSW